MTMAYYDQNDDVRVDYKNHHDWILPRRVFISIFVTGVLLEILGSVLLGIAPYHIDSVRSFHSSGAVLLGLGACLHAILLLLCCHAYCVIYTKDKHTQTQEEDQTLAVDLKSVNSETRVFVDNAPTDISVSAPVSPEPHKSFSTSQRQSPVGRMYVSQINSKTYSDGSPKEPAELITQSETAYGASGTAIEDRSFTPIYAVVNKPPSAMKKSQYDRRFAEKKRVRMSPDVMQDNASLPRYEDDCGSPRAEEKHFANIPQFPMHIDEIESQYDEIPQSTPRDISPISIRSSPHIRYYPDDKYSSIKPEDMVENRYQGTEYASVRYSPDLKQPFIHHSTPNRSETAKRVLYAPSATTISQYPDDLTVTSDDGLYVPYDTSDRPVIPSTPTYDDRFPDEPHPGVLMRPSQRRPVTFEQFSTSKMSVYDNFGTANWDNNSAFLV